MTLAMSMSSLFQALVQSNSLSPSGVVSTEKDSSESEGRVAWENANENRAPEKRPSERASERVSDGVGRLERIARSSAQGELKFE